MSVLTSIDFPPYADAEDRVLFERILVDDPFRDIRTLSPGILQELANSHGADYATAALYLRLSRSAQSVAISHTVEGGQQPKIDTPTHVVVMPGAFHLHHKNTGADGGNVLAMARQLGWSSEVVSVGSLGSMQENAEALISHLNNCQSRRIILVSLSKGSADVATAMAIARNKEAFAKVLTWVSISGLTFGTPLVSWLRKQWWRMPGVHLLLWSKGLRFAELAELSHGPNGPLSIAPNLPANMTAIHVIGFPCRKHLRHPWAERGYHRLLPLGPNDGGGILLADAERLPGTVFPVWGADHYLNPFWDFSPILRSILLHAAASITMASAIPATRSIK